MKEGLRSTVNGAHVDGEGELWRKRKRVKGPSEKDDGGDDDDGVVSNGIVNERSDSGSVLGNGLGGVEDSAVPSLEAYVKEEMGMCEPLGCGANVTNTDFDGHANGDAGQSGGVATKRKRGRKRKKTEVSRLEDGSGKKLENAVLGAMTQVNVRVLRSRTMASANGVCVENVDGKTENGIVQADKKKIKVEEEEDEIVRPIGRKRKRKKGRRGRPPKINSGKEAPGMATGQKKKAVGSKEKLREKSNKLLGGATTEDSKSSEPCKSSANESKEENGTSRREEKQLLREQIMEMLIKAGWKIDYRPRNGREYNDAVYVDLEGRTYWSITKAYRKLKETVDDGVAVAQEIAAFAVIPDEVFSKLFRVIEKKRNDLGTKKSKGVTEKKLAQNKSSSKKIADSKCKQKSNLSRKSHGRKLKLNPEEGRNKKRYALLPRGSENGSNPDGNGFVLYDGKRSLLSWMIDLGTIPQCAKVQYMNPRRTRVMLEGKITGDGIRCGCCNDIHTIFGFESHAGSKLSQPFKNIYLKSGRSLLECLVDSWSKQEKIDKIGFCSVDVAGDDPNDDTCNICGDGGDLICCDGCPSTFHQSCLGIEHFPTGDWHCLYCSCKFCGTTGGKTSQDDDNHSRSVAKLFTCRLCEEKFHMPCIEGKDALRTNSKTPSFCGEGCQKLFNGLRELLGVRHEFDEGFSWTILQLCDVGKGVSLSDDPLKVECNSKLAVAFSVMDECFLPIVDQRSKSNMIHNVVYSCGSNFKRLNYSGFYTIVLERGDEIISAASIRIHGTQLAEMPFIATRYRYRRQGMGRRLLSAVEMALRSLDVENLLIPAISELMETWTKIFGFMPLEESKRREMRFMSMIVFPGTDMLQKPLQKHQLTNEKMTSAAGPELRTENEPKAEDQTADELLMASDPNASAEARTGEIDETDAPVGSGASLPDDSLNDTGFEGAELRTENEPRAEDQTLDELPKKSAVKCFPESGSNSSSKLRIEKDEANAAIGSAVSLSDGSLSDAGCEGAELRTKKEPKADDQAVDELPDKSATKKHVKAETAIGSGVNSRDDFMNDVSDITNVTSKERNNEQCPDLNEPVDDRDAITPETSPAKGQPFDARQSGDEKKTCQSPQSGPVSLHFGEKIVKCIPKLLPQSSH